MTSRWPLDGAVDLVMLQAGATYLSSLLNPGTTPGRVWKVRPMEKVDGMLGQITSHPTSQPLSQAAFPLASWSVPWNIPMKLKPICLPFRVPTAWQSRENSFSDLTTRGQQGQQSFCKFAEDTRWWFGCYFLPFTTQPQTGPHLTPVHSSPWLWGQTKRIGTCTSKCDYLIHMQ